MAEAIKKRKKGVLLTTLHHGQDLKISYKWFAEGSPDYDLEFPDRKTISLCLQNEQAEFFIGETQGSILKEVFVEPIIPKPLLVIAGGGYVGQALANQADLETISKLTIAKVCDTRTMHRQV